MVHRVYGCSFLPGQEGHSVLKDQPKSKRMKKPAVAEILFARALLQQLGKAIEFHADFSC
jgi:hypothetical protein